MEESQLSGNKKRATWRTNCRESLGIKIKPSEIRLKPTDESYAWKIDSPCLEPLFQKHLSKHSVGTYIRLVREVGVTFHAVKVPKEVSSDGESFILSLKSENLALIERLRIAEEQVSLQENALERANAEIQNQISLVEEAQRASTLHQENCQEWIELCNYYQLKCLQGSNALCKIMGLIQETTSDCS